MPHKRIRAVALDGFKTAIQQKIVFESPLKEFVTYAWPSQKDRALTVLRPLALTRGSIDYDDMIVEAEHNKIFRENASDFTMAKYAAEVAMEGHLRSDAYARNPELNDVLTLIRHHKMRIGIISDLAASFGPIADYHLNGISNRLYSFETGCIKASEEPFIMLAERMGVDVEEIAFVGDNLDDDYLTPKKLYMESFLYIPDKESFAKKNFPKGERTLRLYENDIVTTLPEVFEKLEQRGYTLGF